MRRKKGASTSRCRAHFAIGNSSTDLRARNTRRIGVLWRRSKVRIGRNSTARGVSKIRAHEATQTPSPCPYSHDKKALNKFLCVWCVCTFVAARVLVCALSRARMPSPVRVLVLASLLPPTVAHSALTSRSEMPSLPIFPEHTQRHNRTRMRIGLTTECRPSSPTSLPPRSHCSSTILSAKRSNRLPKSSYRRSTSLIACDFSCPSTLRLPLSPPCLHPLLFVRP